MMVAEQFSSSCAVLCCAVAVAVYAMRLAGAIRICIRSRSDVPLPGGRTVGLGEGIQDGGGTNYVSTIRYLSAAVRCSLMQHGAGQRDNRQTN